MAETFDVVVVGGGGSGLAAAIEARRAGARVVLLEKNPNLGGSTSWSIGSVTSSRTPHQERQGIADSPADHFADMPLFAGDLAGRDNDALRRILCDEIPETFRWLIAQGVRFYGPMPEPPHRQPRMHNVLPNSNSFIYHLGRAARDARVDLRTGVRVKNLVFEGGRVNGVACEGGGTFRALRAVVLAAGDFTSDPSLKAHYIGAREAQVDGVNPTATGDGQKMALRLGASILNGDLALGPELRFIAPARATLVRRLPPWPLIAWTMDWSMRHLPPRWLRPFIMSFLTTALAPSPGLFAQGAVLVNREGRRFCEDIDPKALALALADQPEKYGYILIDGRLAKRFSEWPNFVSTAPGIAYAYIPDYRRNRPDVFTQASSLAGLGKKLQVPPEDLAAALRGAGGSQGAAEPPFIALGPVRPVFVHNEGGLAVDAQHRVLGAGETPIPGLFAAGSTGQGGLLLKGHGHHLAWAFVSGRRAGLIAAAEPPLAA
jgi:succinate dehydrogenase/fumarate reductase flavoprotein subunit